METLRLAIIGCGATGRWHAGEIARLGDVQVVGLVDPDPAQIRGISERVPALAEAPAFATPAELYATVGVDGVLVMSPHTLHHPQILEAVRRGVHVLTEKPMVCEAAHAREIEAAAEAAGVVVTISYQRRMDPGYVYMRETIERGGLGELRSISITCGQRWGSGTRNGWRQRPELSGGGMLMDTGSHIVDLLCWLADRPARAVNASVDNRSFPVDIDTTAMIAFDGGLRAQLTILGEMPVSWVESVIVTGSDGVLRYENDPQHPWRPGHVVHYRENEIASPLDVHGGPDFSTAWVETIRGRRENPVPPSAGVRVAELTEAIYASSRTATAVDVAGPAPSPF
jgi:predicted dehydrogenase